MLRLRVRAESFQDVPGRIVIGNRCCWTVTGGVLLGDAVIDIGGGEIIAEGDGPFAVRLQRLPQRLPDRDRAVVVGNRRRWAVAGGGPLGGAAVAVGSGQVVAEGDGPFAVRLQCLPQRLPDRDRAVVVGDRRHRAVTGGGLLG